MVANSVFRPQVSLKSLRQDVPAGLAVAAVALPSAIAYPAIAGLPPVVGIYSSIVPLVAYAIFGSSRKLMTGPDAATMTMLAASLVAIAVPGERVLAASAIAVMVGGFCLAARLLRFGVIASFLSRPILVGFMAGISLSILIGQIGRFTGLSIKADGLVPPLVELARRTREINWPSLALATAMFVVLQGLRGSRIPGPVVVVVVSTILAALLPFAAWGIAMVGPIPEGLPSLSMPAFAALPLRTLVLDSAAVFLVGFGAGIVTARSFGAIGGYDVDPNRELVGFGAANIATGLFGGFPITASDSRTAINMSAGGQTQTTGLVAAAALSATLMFLGGALRLLPIPALGAILAAAAISLIDVSAMRQLWKISRAELVFALISMWGAISLGVLNGVIIAVAATLAHLLHKSMKPRDALLGRIPDRDGFYKLHRNADAAPVPGLTVMLIQGNLLFYNVDEMQARIKAVARDQAPGTRWFIIDASAITQIDSTAAAMLLTLCEDFAKRGISLGFADLHADVRHLLRAAGVFGCTGEAMVFESLTEVEPALARAIAENPAPLAVSTVAA
jgi:sulfate permease, SulP family